MTGCAIPAAGRGADIHDLGNRHLRQRRQPARDYARRLRPGDGADAVPSAWPLRHDRGTRRAEGGHRQAPPRHREASAAGRIEVISGRTVINEATTAISNSLAFISTALLVFALISLFIGGFTIFNTFTITIGQRTRELALLRVVGASRRQVFGSVLGEAALTGLLASLIGLGLGVAAALGLKALLKAFGVVLPSAPLVFEARTPAVALAVGIGVALLSAVLPARRAVRIAPVAALADHTQDGPQSLRRRRVIAGSAIAIAGVGAVVAGVTEASILLVGIGALAVFVAGGMLLPLVAAPLSSALGRPLAAVLGAPGRLGRRNSTRNPMRTAQTAAALMIGLALVSTIAVLGNSLATSAKHNVDSAVAADYVVTGSGTFSSSVVPAVSRLPGVVDDHNRLRRPVRIPRDALTSLAASSTTGSQRPSTCTSPPAAERRRWPPASCSWIAILRTRQPSARRFGGRGQIRADRSGDDADRRDLRLQPAGRQLCHGHGFFRTHFNNPLPSAVLVSTASGTRGFETTLNRSSGRTRTSTSRAVRSSSSPSRKASTSCSD